MHTISLPLSIAVSGKTNFALNLNQYRNAHHMTLNRAKVLFKALVAQDVLALPAMERVKLVYTVFPKTATLFDVGNVCSVVDKFFSDALVELGRLPDDNYRYLAQVTYRFGEIDRINPRVEVQIEDVSPMKIILNEQELHAAATAWVQNLGIMAPGLTANVTLIGGGTGKNNEYGAEVEFVYAQKAEEPLVGEQLVAQAPLATTLPVKEPVTEQQTAGETAGKQPAATQASLLNKPEPDLVSENEENSSFQQAAEAGKQQTGASLFNR